MPQESNKKGFGKDVRTFTSEDDLIVRSLGISVFVDGVFTNIATEGSICQLVGTYGQN